MTVLALSRWLRAPAQFLALFAALCLAAPLAAQDAGTGLFAPQAGAQFWVQIEAQPDPVQAEERARAWSAVFPDVQGYRLQDGLWFAIALGPYDRAGAEAQLALLLRENLIPADSFLTDGAGFGPMFWPMAGASPDPVVGTDALTQGSPRLPEPVLTQPLPEPGADLTLLPDETPEAARAAEARLTQGEREGIQAALAWFGFYQSTLDGAFGRGTRASMAAWQSAMGLEPTGVLTTAQRNRLMTAYQQEQAGFGFAPWQDADAGLALQLPEAIFGEGRLDPPFLRFAAKDGSGAELALISAPGGAETLSGLYDLLQNLAIMPAGSAGSLSETGFTLRGEDDAHVILAEATVVDGAVKGWMLSFAPSDQGRMDRVLASLRTSFRSTGPQALEPGMVPLDEAARQGLLEGLEVKAPKRTASGFYVDDRGSVMTTAELASACGRILLDGVTEARLTRADAATGLAVLQPLTPLAPAEFARLPQTAPTTPQKVVVAGYSYGERLSAPVLSFGTLAERGGLDGETGVSRLKITVRDGDSGGPVLAPDGTLAGVLLPRPGGSRVLPADVAYAADIGGVVAALASAGIPAAPDAAARAELDPDSLSQKALGMTVLVSCYE